MVDSLRKSNVTWLTGDRAKASAFRNYLKSLPNVSADSVPIAIAELDRWVNASDLSTAANQMFQEAIDAGHYDDPLGEGAITDWNDFIVQLAKAVQFAPMFFVVDADSSDAAPDSDKAAGLVGFPINALVNWPMATRAGDLVFRNSEFNVHMKAVLDSWSETLQQLGSTNVLDPEFVHHEPPAIGWLNPDALVQVNAVALSASGQAVWPGKDGRGQLHPDPVQQFQDIFNVKEPSAPKMGFVSWDDFFTRTFKEGQRPVPTDPPPGAVLNACESGPLQYIKDVSLTGTFEAKDQAYSLSNIFGERQDLAEHFVGGSIYQAFLSALSYHRWHAPVSGTLVEGYVIDGSYYWENPYEGYKAAPGQADSSAPNFSQPFLSAVAARGVMVIDTQDLGLVAVVTIGMAEVGSNQITAKVNQPITAGDQLGMFHFGGSTHCLIFEKDIEVTFAENVKVTDKPNYSSNNVAVRSLLATAKRV